MVNVVAGLIALAGSAAAIGARADEGPSLAGLSAACGRAAAALSAGRTGPDVQREQDAVVAGLEAMIAAREQEAPLAAPKPGREGQLSDTQPSPTTAAPVKAAEESLPGAAEWQAGRLTARGIAGTGWLPELPASDRTKVLETFSAGRLPRRYEEALRAYNTRLARTPDVQD